MNRELITITIEAPSSNDLKNSRDRILKSCNMAKMNINNGSKIRISSCNAGDHQQLTSLFGNIKWWSLGRESEKKNNGQKPKGFWDKFKEDLGNFGKEVAKA